jgi:pyrroloquinoline-quinone synthase
MDPGTSIDALIQRRHLLKHPFYVAWSKGDIPVKTLQQYAGQYYHFESNFPRYVAGVYAKETDPAKRRILLQNLVDEEGRSPTHPELWSRFATAIGAPDPASEPHRRMGGTRALTEAYESLTVDGPINGGLGALYAYESIFPEVAREKARGLRAHYGVKSRKALEFFTVHEKADKAHSAAERELLAAHIADSPGARRQAEEGARRSLAAWWTFLDGFMP